jgi:hypothetical protein
MNQQGLTGAGLNDEKTKGEKSRDKVSLRDESTSAYTVVNGVAADSKPQLICIFL